MDLTKDKSILYFELSITCNLCIHIPEVHLTVIGKKLKKFAVPIFAGKTLYRDLYDKYMDYIF